MSDFAQRNSKWIIAGGLVATILGIIAINSCRSPAMMVRIPPPPHLDGIPAIKETYVSMALMPTTPQPPTEQIIPIKYPPGIPTNYYWWCIERSTNNWEWAFDQWCNPDSNGTQTVTQRTKIEYIRIAGYDPAFVRIQ